MVLFARQRLAAARFASVQHAIEAPTGESSLPAGLSLVRAQLSAARRSVLAHAQLPALAPAPPPAPTVVRLPRPRLRPIHHPLIHLRPIHQSLMWRPAHWAWAPAALTEQSSVWLRSQHPQASSLAVVRPASRSAVQRRDPSTWCDSRESRPHAGRSRAQCLQVHHSKPRCSDTDCQAGHTNFRQVSVIATCSESVRSLTEGRRHNLVSDLRGWEGQCDSR
eukprot:SAG11_NODE_3226_length_2598_cov_3.362145_2_plen_221_part_00